jgi:predicted enzyme related to lactoylglutathione lyase
MTARPIMHLEIPTPDLATTAQSYATLFGWTPTSHPNAYTTFQTGNLSGGYPDLVRGFRPVIDHLPAGGTVFYVPPPR